MRPDGPACLAVVNDDGQLTTEGIEADIARIAAAKTPILHKIVGSLEARFLWATLRGPSTVVLLSAHDLRQHGVRLSRSLSWELAVENLAEALEARQPPFDHVLDGNAAVVVVFDVEAAAIVQPRPGKSPELTLTFDPETVEGDVAGAIPGDMIGKLNAFTAGLANALARKPGPIDTGFAEAVAEGLNAARRLAVGTIKAVGDEPRLPDPSAPVEKAAWSHEVASVEDPATDGSRRLRPRGGADIRAADGPRGTLPKPEDVVRRGRDALGPVPSLSIGDLLTVDRKEIEGFRGIRRLMTAYLAAPGRTKPLSLLV
ncbi:MAG: hypothetical protein AAFU70_13860, partial [Planctomycetota bacterium]